MSKLSADQRSHLGTLIAAIDSGSSTKAELGKIVDEAHDIGIDVETLRPHVRAGQAGRSAIVKLRKAALELLDDKAAPTPAAVQKKVGKSTRSKSGRRPRRRSRSSAARLSATRRPTAAPANAAGSDTSATPGVGLEVAAMSGDVDELIVAVLQVAGSNGKSSGHRARVVRIDQATLKVSPKGRRTVGAKGVTVVEVG